MSEFLVAEHQRIVSIVDDTIADVERGEPVGAVYMAGLLVNSTSRLASRNNEGASRSVTQLHDLLVLEGCNVSKSQVLQEMQAMHYSIALLAVPQYCPPAAASNLRREVEQAVRGLGKRYLRGLATGAPLPDADLLRERQSYYEAAFNSFPDTPLIGLADVFLQHCFVDAGRKPPSEYSSVLVIQAMREAGSFLAGVLVTLVHGGWTR